ncbi:hypothetical protein [Streptomyces poriticola]|uniref:hypothetical protein n=1 Tax=Streptomyces poriticola TaxID=3120506 RepID=UPI002FCE4B65
MASQATKGTTTHASQSFGSKGALPSWLYIRRKSAGRTVSSTPRPRCGTAGGPTARDLPGGRRNCPLGFGAYLLGLPTRHAVGDGQFLRFITDLLKLPAQLLRPHLQLGPASGWSYPAGSCMAIAARRHLSWLFGYFR